jgi:trehalose 6-phosphate phosphatase
VLFLDFDGTLVPIAKRPEDPRLAVPMRQSLRRLAKRPNVCIVILSGRRRTDLVSRVRLRRIKYLGLYGGEKEGRVSLPRETRKRLLAVRSCISRAVRNSRGMHLENKQYTLAIHYREAAAPVIRRVRSQLHRCLRKSAPEFRIVRGRKVWEVVPQELGDKAAAIRTELHDLPRFALVICAGDTEADEGAFAALRGAVTVHVGSPRSTQARFWLRDPAEVGLMLEWIAEVRE